jgi:hypothetical protein
LLPYELLCQGFFSRIDVKDKAGPFGQCGSQQKKWTGMLKALGWEVEEDVIKHKYVRVSYASLEGE